MSKKVSELASELEMTINEIKVQSERLGIIVKTANSSMSDADAKRLTDTMNLLRGTASLNSEKKNGKSIKAVPIKNISAVKSDKAGMPVPKPKPVETHKDKATPMQKPVEKLKAEPAVNAESESVTGNFEEEPKASVQTEEEGKMSETCDAEKFDEDMKQARNVKIEEKIVEISQNAEISKKSTDAENVNLKTDESANRGDSDKVKQSESVETKKDDKTDKSTKSKQDVKKSVSEGAEKPHKIKKEHRGKGTTGKNSNVVNDKKNEKKEEYVNTPDKPMRFKKVFDASKEHVEPKPQSHKNSVRKNKNRDNNAARHAAVTEGGSKRTSRTGAAVVESVKSGGGKTKKFFGHNKDYEKDRHKHSKKDNERRTGKYFDERSLEKQGRRKKNRPKPVEPEIVPIEEMLPEGTIPITVPITIAGLAEQAEISTSKLIMSLMRLGIMATVNQNLDKDTVEVLAEELGVSIVVTEEEPKIEEEGLDLHEDSENELEPRAPIITVMGHVDHGKTSLLDAIRNTNVTARESGGITQHIGASEVEINGKKIVFLDTPGHEAFTTMRARGAQITDIAVLVVAADDSVKPQTIESISHAKAANVPIIVAINKIDKPGANPDRVKKDLADNGVLVEDWGGDVISVPVSAKSGDGINDILEMILLQAEVLELRANSDRLAMGNVIEASLDKARGPVATLLVMNGTLKTGQSIVAGTCHGRIRKMINAKGESIRKAPPATPVEILGLNDVPMAGDAFNAVKDDKTARDIAENRANKMRDEVLAKNSSTTLEKLFTQIKEGETKELNLIIKADVQGSVGAIVTSLEKLNNEDVKVKIIHGGVGTITESDVMLAETSEAIVVGFNVRPTTAVINQAAEAGVEVRLYRVIYDIIDDVRAAMKGMLEPEYKEEVLGKVKVRNTFKVPNVGIIAGGYVTEGKIKRNAEIRLVRDGIVIHEGKISSLRRFKDDVKEVAQGYECGIGIEDYNDIKVEDTMECFQMVEIKRD